jgi:carbonic anhydrase
MQNIIGLAAFVASTQAADWNYAQNGADWPDLEAACGATNQSPIDLKTDTSGYTIFDAADDDITKIYQNQKGATVNWNGHTS